MAKIARFFSLNKRSEEHEEKTVQDLFNYDEITDKGIVRVGDTYTSTMELNQINLQLMDFIENSIVWKNFRTMLNSINIRHSYILQSHFFDVSDFVKEYEQKANSLEYLTPELIFAKDDVLKNYQTFTEERNREQKSFIIFRYNPNTEGIETGLETGNAAFDEILANIKSKTAAVDNEESRSIALSVLEEMTELAYQLLFQLGIKSVRLNRVGVLDMIYGTLNRDLTTSQRLLDASNAGSFTEFKVSDTPNIISSTLDYVADYENQLFEDYLNTLEDMRTNLNDDISTNEKNESSNYDMA